MKQTRQLIALLLMLLLAGFSQSLLAEDKFAIAADGAQPMAQIVKLAGTAPYFHIYDINGKQIEVLANPHMDLEYGMGPAAAATLADMGVTVLVTQRIPGPKMAEVLEERGVRVVRRRGPVLDVVNELRE